MPALQYLRLRAEVLSRLGAEAVPGAEELPMLDERIRATLESLFAERFPEIALETVRAAHRAPPAEDPAGAPVLDDLAYAGDLRDRLLAAVVIGEPELAALATQRAEAIRAAFLAGGEFAAGRITVSPPTEAEPEGDEWIVMELGLAAAHSP